MRFLLDKNAILTSHNTGTYESSEYHKGGAKESSTTPVIPEWARPYAENYLKTAQGVYDSGDLGRVAGLTGQQRLGFQQGEQAAGRQVGLEQGLARDANITYGDSQARFATDAALNRGADEAGMSNNLGGSRNAFNNSQIHSAGQSAYSAELEGRRLNALQSQGVGAGTMQGIGGATQQQRQNELDSEATALGRLSGAFQGNIPQGSKTVQSGGGK